MKTVKLIIAIMVAAGGLFAQSCNSSDDAVASAPSSSNEKIVLLSRSDAQSQINDLVANNTYLDYDFSAPSPAASLRQSNAVPEDETITRVIWYRFYKLMAFDKDHIVVKGTAKDINISQRAYEFCMSSINRINLLIAERLSAGDPLEEVIRDHYNITPESIEKVIRLS